MLLENEKIEMNWSNRNRSAYEQRRYDFTKNKDALRSILLIVLRPS